MVAFDTKIWKIVSKQNVYKKVSRIEISYLAIPWFLYLDLKACTYFI